MANLKSTLATAYSNTISLGGPQEWQLPGVIEAPVRCFIDYYTAVGTEAASDKILFFTDGINKVLPAGANILKIDFIMSASIASLTADVGDLNSATRYANGSSLFTASTTAFTIYGWVSGVPYIIGTNPSTAVLGAITNGDNQICLTLHGAFTLTAGTIITAIMYYTLTN